MGLGGVCLERFCACGVCVGVCESWGRLYVGCVGLCMGGGVCVIGVGCVCGFVLCFFFQAIK